LTTNSDARKNLSWQTFRIGWGVKKTVAIAAEQKNYKINGSWLFAGEGALFNASPSPKLSNQKNIALSNFFHTYYIWNILFYRT
jgi:hypothetical protein